MAWDGWWVALDGFTRVCLLAGRGPKFIPWPPLQPFATDIILKLMERDPVKRYGKSAYGAGDVFVHPWFGDVDWERLKNRRITVPYLPKLRGDGDASECVPCFFLDSAYLSTFHATDLRNTQRTRWLRTAYPGMIHTRMSSLILNIPARRGY